MRLYLHQYDFLDLETICSNIAKESLVNIEDIKKEIWSLFWKGDFIDENKTMFYISSTCKVHSIPLMDVDSTLPKDHVCIIVKRKKNKKVEDIELISNYNEQVNLCCEEDYKTKIINMINARNINNGFLEFKLFEDIADYIKSRLHDLECFSKYGAVLQWWEKKEKQEPLERVDVFNLIQNNINLPYKPKSFVVLKDNVLIDPPETEYAKFAEHKINPGRYLVGECYIGIVNPMIDVEHFRYVLSKYNTPIPKFLEKVKLSDGYKDKLKKDKRTEKSKMMNEKKNEKYTTTFNALKKKYFELKQSTGKSDRNIACMLSEEANKAHNYEVKPSTISAHWITKFKKSTS